MRELLRIIDERIEAALRRIGAVGGTLNLSNASGQLPPSSLPPHASTHQAGGTDPVQHDLLVGATAEKHRVILTGTLASRPAAGQADRFYWATDTGELYRDTGSAWQLVSGNPSAHSHVEADITNLGATVVKDGDPAGGDLSGTYPSPQVVGLRGRPLGTQVPEAGNVLTWNGTEWVPGVGAGSFIPFRAVLGYGDGSTTKFILPNTVEPDGLLTFAGGSLAPIQDPGDGPIDQVTFVTPPGAGALVEASGYLVLMEG